MRFSATAIRMACAGFVLVSPFAIALAKVQAAPVSVVASNGTATAYAELADVPWASLSPGARVLMAGAVFHTLTIVAARGTAAAPIIIEPAPGTHPILENSIFFQGASHVVLSGLRVEGSAYAGIAIRNGSDHITVSHNSVDHTGLGIWIGDGAGTGQRLIGNTLTDNKTHGIAVDLVNADPADRSVIDGNDISGSGYHGIEINGSWYVVEHNRVHSNGVGLSGTSAIHVFARDAAQDAGDGNIIRYNMAWDQHDPSGQDGNGIQIDQWCDDNLAAFNVVFDNDGAGLNIFDGARNTLLNNTAYGDMRDPGASHAYPAEIVIASDYVKGTNHARGNRIVNNIAVATRLRVSPLYVEATSTGNGNSFGPNLLFNKAGGPLVTFGRSVALRAGDIAAATQGRVRAFIEAPSFARVDDPANGGLGLSEPLSQRGEAIDIAPDILGRPMPAQGPGFGAYFAAVQ